VNRRLYINVMVQAHRRNVKMGVRDDGAERIFSYAIDAKGAKQIFSVHLPGASQAIGRSGSLTPHQH
jgi:hypothetical protein